MVASLTLMSKTIRYNDKHKKLLGNLPGIENALLTAVYYEETDELKERIGEMTNPCVRKAGIMKRLIPTGACHYL